jgi:hypothetical protein
MMRGLTDLLGLLGVLLPSWAVGVVLALIGLAIAPFWWSSMRTKQMRGKVRQMVRAEPEERDALQRQIMEIAGTHPFRLANLCREATRYGQFELRREALAALKATGKLVEDVRIFDAQSRADPKTPFAHPLGAVAIVEGLIADGLEGVARDRLRQARAQFPRSGELSALADRLEDSEPGQGPEGA